MGYKVHYITSGKLLEDLTAALADQTIHNRVRFYAKFDLLIIDEFGFDRIERAVCPQAASLWYKIIDARSQRVSTALVTNIDFEAWADSLGDAPLGNGACWIESWMAPTIVKLKGKIYRACIAAPTSRLPSRTPPFQSLVRQPSLALPYPANMAPSQTAINKALTYTASTTGFRSLLIEKDYYCSLVLQDLVDHFHFGLVFKGGTCLSKVHLDFYRLSEDLDFVISIPATATPSKRSAAVAPIRHHLASLCQRLDCFTETEVLKGHNGSRQYNGLYSYRSVVTGAKKNGSGLKLPFVSHFSCPQRSETPAPC